VRAAILCASAQERPAGQLHGRPAVEVLHGILEPPVTGARTGEADEWIDPAGL
jgi:hypothetical protein